jgi:hypothetical protein
VTTAAAVIAAAILAVLAGSALADDSLPPVPAQTDPALTQPAVTTADPADAPVQPTVPAPVDAVPATDPIGIPVPGQEMQAFLIKRFRGQIVLYLKSAWHWQHLAGLKLSPGPHIWSLGTPEAGRKVLAAWKIRSRRAHLAAQQRMKRLILVYKSNVEHWRQVAGIRPQTRRLSGRATLEGQYAWWRSASDSVSHQAANPPHKYQFLCIHSHEGSWKDSGGPYYGGLQMDIGFQRTYAPLLLRTKGTAEHWTPLEQIWTAEKAAKSRGFNPWPNTARMCGLL